MNRPPPGGHVAIVGGGPSGLAAATALRRFGVERVTVLEREPVAGGIPRHCGHPPFGTREFRRIMKGPDYARQLVDTARKAGVDIRPLTTVTAILPGPVLQLSTPDGVEEITADRVLLATGVRETPRAPRLVSGTRALGVMTTGALQSMVYLKNRRPCARPVIVGSELVSFSALLTCRHAGIQPVAMVEPRNRVTAWRWATALPRWQGIPVLTGTRIVAIEGQERVTGVAVQNGGGSIQRLPCDGVIFSGDFTAEATLVRMSHLELDGGSGGPAVDQYGRCSDGDYFATGNLLHPADSAGFCWREGVRTAGHIARDLRGELPAGATAIRIRPVDPLVRYTVPQRLVPEYGPGRPACIAIRFAGEATGRIRATNGTQVTTSRRLRVLPEQRRSLRLPWRMLQDTGHPIEIDFDE